MGIPEGGEIHLSAYAERWAAAEEVSGKLGREEEPGETSGPSGEVWLMLQAEGTEGIKALAFSAVESVFSAGLTPKPLIAIPLAGVTDSLR